MYIIAASYLVALIMKMVWSVMADILTKHFLQDEFLSYIQGTPKVYPRSTQGAPILLNNNQRHYFPCPKLQKKKFKSTNFVQIV